MNYTLEDLQQLHTSKNAKDEQALEDRHAYIHGKQGYPTGTPESLSEGISERYRTLYTMGYNTAQWENEHD